MKIKVTILAAALALVLGPALRAGAQQSDPWQNYPDKEVRRPSLPYKNGYQFRFYVRTLSTEQAFDKDGKIEDTGDVYNLFTADVRLAYGITDRFAIVAGLPYVTGQIGETKGGNIGDIYGGLMVSPWSSETGELALGVLVSAPTGNSSYHVEVLGDQSKLQNFRTGDPGVDYFPTVSARLNSDLISARIQAAYVITEGAEVTFNRIPGTENTAMVNPGDGIRLEGSFYLQANKWFVPWIGAYYTSISETEADGEGLGDDMMLLEGRIGLLFQIGKAADFSLMLGIPVQGQNAPLGFPAMASVTSRF